VILDDFGLDSGLRWLCERFSQRTGIPVEYGSNIECRLDPTTETHLFRITQESLTNIARHSGATQASVNLSANGSQVRLEICDNGAGLSASAAQRRPSLGVVGMRARARQLGGELTIENQKNGGLRVCASVPLRLREAHAEQESPGFIG
jgi:signal transduction histidine kinase